MYAAAVSTLEDQLSTIYALCEPETGEVRYIGKTRNLRKRQLQHLRPSSLERRSRRSSWLKNLLARGLQPMVCILQEVPVEQEDELERWWIAVYRPNGRLTNETDGGDGVTNPPAEVRALIGNRRITAADARRIRERVAAGESSMVALATEYGVSRHAIGNLVRGQTWPQVGGPIVKSLPRRVSAEALEAASKATRGKPRSDEVRLKISEAKKGRPYPSGTLNPRNAAKVTEAQVLELRRRASLGVSNKDLAAWSGLTLRSVRNIVAGTTWAHLNERGEN
jgi:GIY-YIG catalytic domain